MKRFALRLMPFFLAAMFGSLTWLASDDVVAARPAVKPTAQTASSQAEEGPATVNVGVYVLNVGKLDTSTGAFTTDFYLSFTSDQPTNPGNFEFANGRATSIDKLIDEPTEKFYRIQASLANSLDMSRYPFDRHELTIELEDKLQTTRSQVYQAAKRDSGLDRAVNIVGWNLEGWKSEVNEHYYAPYDETYSRYVFSIQVHRSVMAAILKTILPALVIVLAGLLSLVLTPDKIIPRLTLNTGAFTGAVLFHLNMTSSLPPLGYLTFGDRFMLINYLGLALALGSTLLALSHLDKKRTPDAERVHKFALLTVPLVWAGLQALNILFL